MGFGPTAATVIATDLTPPDRRGAAMGVYGLASAVALAVGPYLGGELVRRLGFARTFLMATGHRSRRARARVDPAGDAARRGSPAAPVDRAGRAAARRGSRRLARFWRRWFSTAAVYPSALVLALYVSYGGLAALAPPLRRAAPAGEPGALLHGLRPREPRGPIPGRPPLGPPRPAGGGRPGPGHLRREPGLLALAASPRAFLAAAALYGVGFGAAQPALLAMTADRAPPGERGRAMGTLYTAWELGISGRLDLAGTLRDPARLHGDLVDRRGDRGDRGARGALPGQPGPRLTKGPSARVRPAARGVSARRRARRWRAGRPRRPGPLDGGARHELKPEPRPRLGGRAAPLGASPLVAARAPHARRRSVRRRSQITARPGPALPPPTAWYRSPRPALDDDDRAGGLRRLRSLRIRRPRRAAPGPSRRRSSWT